MASRKSLNAKNLQALGAERLAELLIEISTGNAAAKRRLRLELAGAQGPAEVAREVRKRLATIDRSRSFVDWHNRKALVDDLETQRRAIAEKVAKEDPVEALELMWRFMALAASIFERCDDTAAAVDTPIGKVPADGALDVEGLDVAPETMKTLNEVDAEGWKAELPMIREHFATFGDHLPDELREQLSALERRLG